MTEQSGSFLRFHRLCFLSVIGGFIDGQKFDFAPGLNCLIGVRGTGKTTILELIRYALDALPSRNIRPSGRRNIESLLKHNLGVGRVQLGIETRDGLKYVVSRVWGEEPIVLTAEGEPTGVILNNSRIFQADIYSQNEVEQVADNPVALLHLLDAFEPRKIADQQLDILRLQSSLATNGTHILPIEQRLSSLNDELSQLPNVESQLKGVLTGSNDNTAVIDQAYVLKNLRDKERHVAARVAEGLQAITVDMDQLEERLASVSSSLLDRDIIDGPNREHMAGIFKHLQDCEKHLDGLLGEARHHTTELQQQINEQAGRLAKLHRKQELAFRDLLERHRKVQHKKQGDERLHLEKFRNDLLHKRQVHKAVCKKLMSLRLERDALLAQLSELRDRLFAARQSVADQINQELSPGIRVTLSQYGNTTRYQRLLENHLRHAHLKHGVVAHKLVRVLCPVELADAVRHKNVNLLIDRAELNHDQAEKTIAALSDIEILLELEAGQLLDLPKIELKDGEGYKDSSVLSTGQKCTAILPILMMDSDNPLLIDQPEDNLDNRFIYESIVDKLCDIKQKRQLIFVTHNPNIPVVANADKVFVLESDGSSARIAHQGTVEECRSEIVTLLEGGEEAFSRRKERYFVEQ